MSDRLKALREKRGVAVRTMREILERAETEKRDASAEELAKHEGLFKEQDDLRRQIEAIERQEAIEQERRTAELDDELKRRGDAGEGGGREVRAVAKPEYRKAFAAMLRGGAASLSADQVRALASATASEGGFTVAPEQFTNELIKAVDDQVLIRRWARTFRVERSLSMGAPSLDADASDAEWTSETSTGSADSSLKFGKRELKPSQLAKQIKISNKLMRVSSIDIEGLVRDRLAYKFGVTEEKHFMVGTGASQPLGIFTASTDGIPTGRDVVTGSATDYTMDGLITAKYGLKAQYLAKAVWLFHRDGVAKIAKLKDTTNQYLWQPSKQVGEPDMLLGHPVYMSEFAPNTFTTGKYVGMFADFSHYWIADALDLEIQRLVELYAATAQTGFIARAEVDGMPVLAEAFVRVKTS